MIVQSTVFQTGRSIYLFGHWRFLQCFFSTICCRLEDGQWGSRYPYLMKEFYQGSLAWEHVPYARKELQEVEARFKQLPPTQVIWDAEDLNLPGPWEKIGEKIPDLAALFVTSSGANVIGVLFRAFDDAEELQEKLEILAKNVEMFYRGEDRG